MELSKRIEFSANLSLIIALTTLLLAACAAIGGPAVAGRDVAATRPAQARAAAAQETTGANVIPIKVTYFTPAQTEGPYYPVEKPADRDNDLVDLAGASGTAAGDILEFDGTLYDGSGMPVAGAIIEIWQTDNNGIYLHPNDRGRARRDVNFQSYGEAVTADDGSYHFRTIVPGRYEPRPRHIHVKVRLNGQEQLTTQFYFDNDPTLASDSIFAGASEEQEAMIMQVDEGVDAAGSPALLGKRDIILRRQLPNP